MKKLYLVKQLLLLLSGILCTVEGYSIDAPKLMLDLEKVKLTPGELYQLPSTLNYVETSGSDTIEVAVVWTVAPDSLGSIDEFAVFTAIKPGEGYLHVSYESVKDSVELEIEIEDETEADEFPKLLLSFEKVKLNADEIFQLPLVSDYIESLGGDTVEVAVAWTVAPDSLGSIDEFAVFTAIKPGEGYLHVSYESVKDSVELEIEMKNEEEKDTEDLYPKVKIIPGSVKVELDDSLELYAFYVDSLNNKADTTFLWTVEPASLGLFPDTEVPVFHSKSLGEGIIVATLGELSDTIKIRVYEKKWKDKNKNKNGNQLEIIPGDTIVIADAGMIQYSAFYEEKGGIENDTTDLIWNVSDTTIATIDENGLLALSGTTGLTLVNATYKNSKTSVELLVIDPNIDPEINTITVHRVLPDGKILNPKVFKEGDSYAIGGLPYPLNLLNSGMLHFPFGCISEDITIYMKIPEKYAALNHEEAEVLFNDEIITGVEFNVQPVSADTIVHPFWFNVPVELKLPFKRGLLNSLGIDPHTLDVYFAENTQFVPVADGFATVDSTSNMIYASIEHFSTIIVRKSEVVTLIEEPSLLSVDLLSIYPNPFSTSTTIQVHLKEAGNVKIEMYNLAGQKVKILTDRNYDKGSYSIMWTGTDVNNEQLKSGIYLCRFVKDGSVSQLKKLVIRH